MQLETRKTQKSRIGDMNKKDQVKTMDEPKSKSPDPIRKNAHSILNPSAKEVER